jgi:hypothetical protein
VTGLDLGVTGLDLLKVMPCPLRSPLVLTTM